MSKLTEYIASECSPLDTDQLYDEALDSEGDVKVGGLNFSPSQIIKELDPIAYRCGKNDYVDSLGLKEVDGNEYDADEVDKAADAFKNELERSINDLEIEIEDLDEDLDDERKELNAKLDAWRQELAELEEEIKNL